MIDLETPRLKIKPLASANAEDALRYQVKNHDYFKPYAPLSSKDQLTLKYWQRKIWNSQTDWHKDSAYRFYLTLKEDIQENCSGIISFTQVFRSAYQSCLLGFNLDEELRGKGLIPEALEKLIEYIFEDKLIHRINAYYHPNNAASEKVLQKVKFQKEGLIKGYLNINNEWQDHILTSRLNSFL